MSWQVRTLPDRYADSVRLMGIARALRDHEGVSACEVVMGTPANLSALAALGASAEAGPGDVVVAVDGEDGLGDTVLAEVQRLLVGGAPQSDEGPAPVRTLAAIDAANIALISVPGEYATLEAHRAVTRGLHVFLFSDHVSLEDEIALKVYRGPNLKGWVRHKPDGSEGHKGHDVAELPISVVLLGLPYRCLLPAGIENLLVSGKTVSFDNEAHQRVRLMPECIAMGEAAGTAAALAVRDGVTPRQVDVAEVRSLLAKGGLNLDRSKVRLAEVRETLASRGMNVAMA